MSVCELAFLQRFTLLFSSYEANSRVAVQNRTRMLEIIRIWVCTLASLWLPVEGVYVCAALMNLLVGGYKLARITYLSPKLSYSQLVAETWCWLSLAISLLSTSAKMSRRLSLLLPILLFLLCLNPSPKLVTCLSIKLLWNLNRNSPEYDVLVVYFGLRFGRPVFGADDAVIGMLSPGFVDCVRKEVSGDVLREGVIV